MSDLSRAAETRRVLRGQGAAVAHAAVETSYANIHFIPFLFFLSSFDEKK